MRNNWCLTGFNTNMLKHFELRGLLWRFTSIAGLFVLADRRGRHTTSNLGHVKA